MLNHLKQFEFPLSNCTEVFAETKSFVTKYNIHVSSLCMSIFGSELLYFAVAEGLLLLVIG